MIPTGGKPIGGWEIRVKVQITAVDIPADRKPVVTFRVTDRRDKPYVVRAEWCIDEDWREIESAVHRGMRDPKECGKKW